MHCDVTADSFISQLVNDGLSQVPWIESTFAKDFILLAEFSELEGPKPIFTIPRDVKTSFNLEQFSLRIMSADCVSILQTTDLSTFNIAGDIQVVLTEVSEGAVAFVHHFVLYDIRARGYVRPYCLAYVTRNYSRLMEIFQNLLYSFSIVSTLFHFGNTLSFISELFTREEQLRHLKEVLQDSFANISVDDKMLTDSQRDSIIQKDIDENICQLVELRKIFLCHAEEDVYSEHREVFHEKYNQLHHSNVPSNSEDGGGGPSGSFMSWNEECISSTDGVNHDNHENYDEDEFVVSPSCTHQIPSDVISSILGKRYDKPLRHLGQLCDVTYNHGISLLRSILRTQSSSRVDVKAQVQNLPESLLSLTQKDDDCSCSDGRGRSSDRRLSLKCILKKSSACQEKFRVKRRASSCLTEGKRNSLDSDSTSPLGVNSVSWCTSTSSPTERRLTIISDTSSADTSSSVSSRENTASSGISRQTSSESLADYDKISLTSSFMSSSPRDAEVVQPNLLKCPHISLVKLRYKYSFLSHAIYSILIGRSLLVVGEEENKNRVRNLVMALANFIHSGITNKSVIPWMEGSFTLSHIGCTSIVGLMKNRKGKTISNALKPYVSILMLEEETLVAPRYVGKLLTNMLSTTTNFLSDVSYRHFILQLLTEFSAKAFTHFVTTYANPEKGKDIKELHGDEAITFAMMHHMRDTILDSSSHESVGNKSKSTMRLNTFKCSTFSNTSPKKRR